MPIKNALDEFIEATANADTSTGVVPNVAPRVNMPYRLAIIGEAPGADEVREGRPFVGMSGRFLTALLSKAGIVRDACLIGNVCQHRPPANDITKFSRTGPEITAGLEQLGKDIRAFNPNAVLLLGKTALWAAKGTDAVGDWRGSWFIGNSGPLQGFKCLATYHPAACLRQYEWTPILMFDIRKALAGAGRPELVTPSRDLRVDMSHAELLEAMERIIKDKPLIAIDIEGYVGDMKCISIARSPKEAFIVPFTKMDGTSYYEHIDEEVAVWRALAQILGDARIHKVLQNSLYDRFVLQYSYGLVVRGVVGDTMLQHWELYCELEKSLGFQCSLYCDTEPYYKFERKSNDRRAFWQYCCRDSAVTHEIDDKLRKFLDARATDHYQFNVSLLNPLLYMECRGIRYDSAEAARRLDVVMDHIYGLQYELDALSLKGVNGKADKATLLSQVRDVMCYKRDRGQPKKDFVKAFAWAERLLVGPQPLTKSEVARLSTELGVGMNIKSQEFKQYVYTTLKCPPQYHPVTEALTTNYEALLKISKKAPHREIDLALQIGMLRTRSQMLEISADRDGRVRCGYNVVGTETGRLTCYTSPTGSGYNLQTIPSEDPLRPVGHPLRNGMRDLFVADIGHYLFQCDLSGADGWTVAAHLAALGDRTMLDDYLAGIKPAKVLCYMLRHGADSLRGKTRDEIKALTKEVGKESWDYFACKIGQHGTCYLMGRRKLANQIFIQSEGAVNLTENETEDLQRLFMVRYNVKLWHRWAGNYIAKQPYPPKLASAGGNVRRFFGRAREILGEFLAHEPQANTTYATNLALYRLWNDPENRVSKRLEVRVGDTQSMAQRASCLRVEPIHQVHDALLGQFRIEDTAWAVSKIKSWFANPIRIAGLDITIPFEGQYGTNWALDDKSKVGSI